MTFRDTYFELTLENKYSIKVHPSEQNNGRFARWTTMVLHSMCLYTENALNVFQNKRCTVLKGVESAFVEQSDIKIIFHNHSVFSGLHFVEKQDCFVPVS